jgi:hypothetical protein
MAETNPPNCKYLLSIISTFVIQEAEYSDGIFAIILRVLQEEVFMTDNSY